MLNRIWLFMIMMGCIVGVINDKMGDISIAILESAENSVVIGGKLIGPMALWLGIMKIAEDSGLTELIAKVFSPFAKLLFPEVPPKSPALAAITMNLSANLLGLGNSATPLGIKAMQELQKLNLNRERATNAMCTFLVINTSSVTLIPTTVLALRIGAGSNNPTEIIGTTIFATLISTLVGIIVNKIIINLSGLNKYD